MNNVQERRAGTLLLGQVKPGWPVRGVSGKLRAAAHKAPWRNNLQLPHSASTWLGVTVLLEAELLPVKDQTPTDFDLVQFLSGDTSAASEGMTDTEAPALLCSKVIQVLEFSGNCKAPEWKLLPTRKEKQHFGAICGSRNSASSTVNRRRGLRNRLCSYPIFLTLHLLGHKD